VARSLGNVELLTVDSMQVYRGMDIGTAKPTSSERGEIAHHLLDLADPDEEWTVTRWAASARTSLAEIESRGNRALLVGGTGLYFQALVDGFAPPGQFPEVKAELEAEDDTQALHAQLTRIDPLAASRMESTNRRRVVRALEVSIGSGRPFSSYGPGVADYPETTWRIAGLWLPRSIVAARISVRLARMVEAGFVEEVEALRNRANSLSRTARQALGYREILEHLETGAPLSLCLARAEQRTRAFSRRQRVWWRRDPRIKWYGTGGNPFAVIAQLLGNWKLL
jgi:tRNA dimethylallyltransferase